MKETIEAITKMKKSYSNNRPGGKYQNYNKDGGDAFEKGTAKPRNYNNNSGGTWKQEDNQEKAKLKEQAAANIAKIRADKNDTQKIKLILNVIAPDNFQKKFGELRGYLFKGLKSEEECDDEGIQYEEEIHKLTEGSD